MKDKIGVSTWLSKEDIERLNNVMVRKTEEIQAEYPGVQLSRYSLLHQVIIKWLENEERIYKS